ncbi:hypothetical protein [Brevibacterium album]|uniref:hypothetical protein n=1 Tax=Brevibacterium album TaxID=417948 RepID=UPI00041C0A19|nr:hypothetical protein [Brevibacterium album]
MTTPQPAAWSAQVDWRSGTLRAAPERRPVTAWRRPPQPGTLPKRPLTFFETLDGGFRLLRGAPGATFGIALLVQTLAALLVALALTALAVGGAGFLMRTLASSPEAGLGLNVLAQTVALAGTLGSLSIGQLLTGFSSVAGDRAFGGERPRLAEVWRRLAGVRLRLVGLTLLCTAAHVGALLVLMLPGGLLLLLSPTAGVIVGSLGFLAWIPLTAAAFARFALAGSVLALERTGVLESLRRSWRLTRGSFWKTLGQLVLAYFLSSQIVNLVMSPILLVLMAGGFGLALALSLGGGVSDAVFGTVLVLIGVAVTALTMAATALLFAYLCGTVSCVYFDRRMRLEGYDLVLLRRAEQEDAGEEEHA